MTFRATLLIGASLIATSCSAPDDGFDLTSEASPQRTESRIIRSIFGSPMDTLQVSAGAFEPLTVAVDAWGNAYVLDRGSMSVRFFDAEGRLVRTIGGPGSESGVSFEHLSDIGVSGSGDLFALDGGARKVYRFDSTGTAKSQFDLERRADALAVLADGTLAVKFMGPGRFVRVFDAAGTELAADSGPTFDDLESSFPLAGRIVAAGNAGFVFSPFYAGNLALLEPDLDVRYHVKSIEPSPLPGVIDQDGVFTLNSRLARGTYVPISATEDTVYAAFFSRESQTGYLDVYSGRDGSYLYSAKIPDGCAPASISPSDAYLICLDQKVIRVARADATEADELASE